MSAIVDGLLAEFEEKYARLVWPDKNVILDLTAFCERNIAISLHLSDIIIARVIDPATDITHKLPIFYLIDAVMKHVGGPYPALFSRHLAEVFKRAFDELPIKEKERLDFLLVTWEERRMLGPELLSKMRAVVAAKKAVSAAAEMVHATADARIREAQRIAAILSSAPTLQQQQLQRRQQEMLQQQQQHQQRRQQEDEQRQQQQQQQQQQQTSRYDNSADDRGISPNQSYPQRRQQQQQSDSHHPTQNQQGRNQQQQQPHRRYDSHQQQQSHFKRPRDDGPLDRDRDRDRQQQQLQGRDRDRERQRSQEHQTLHRGITNSTAINKNVNNSMNSSSRGISDRAADRNDRGADRPSFTRAVEIEMENLLRHMYADMDVKETIPLDKLAVANSDLFARMRTAAEATVKLNGYAQTRDSSDTIINDSVPKTRRQTLRSATGLGVGIYPSYVTGDDVESDNVTMKSNNCGPLVNAFLAEAPVVLDIGRAEALLKQLLETEIRASTLSDAETLFNVLDEKFGIGLMAATHHVADRLKLLLSNCTVPPKLPTILFGPLPLEPSKEFLLANADSIAASVKPVVRQEKPRFRAEELDKRAPSDRFNATINNLYKNQKYQYVEDGIRFKTLVELVKHTDACLTKKEMNRKQDQANERVCRQWYCTVLQWMTDFSALGGGNSKNQGHGSALSSSSSMVTEEFVVPADEHFTRCPVSKEVFETVWDEDEGAFMYRNAVKILVTEVADSVLYRLALPTEQDGVQYMIVHKLLVLDGWLQSGRAETLTGATLRYEAMGRGSDTATALAAAAGDDEDADDVFVMLELLT